LDWCSLVHSIQVLPPRCSSITRASVSISKSTGICSLYCSTSGGNPRHRATAWLRLHQPMRCLWPPPTFRQSFSAPRHGPRLPTCTVLWTGWGCALPRTGLAAAHRRPALGRTRCELPPCAHHQRKPSHMLDVDSCRQCSQRWWRQRHLSCQIGPAVPKISPLQTWLPASSCQLCLVPPKLWRRLQRQRPAPQSSGEPQKAPCSQLKGAPM